MAAIQRGRLKAPYSVQSLYFTCSEMYASVILRRSKRKGLGIACFNFPPMMKRYIDSGQSWNLDHIIYPFNSLSPIHLGFCYDAHVKDIIEKKIYYHI